MLSGQTTSSRVTNWQSEYQRQFVWKDTRKAVDISKPAEDRFEPSHDAGNAWASRKKNTSGQAWGEEPERIGNGHGERFSGSERPNPQSLRDESVQNRDDEEYDDAAERDEEDYVSRREPSGKPNAKDYGGKNLGVTFDAPSRAPPEMPKKLSRQKTPDIISYGSGNTRPSSADLYMKTFNTTVPTSEVCCSSLTLKSRYQFSSKQIYPNTVEKISRQKVSEEDRATRRNRKVETPAAFRAFLDAKKEATKVGSGFQTEYQREFQDWTKSLLVVKEHPAVARSNQQQQAERKSDNGFSSKAYDDGNDKSRRGNEAANNLGKQREYGQRDLRQKPPYHVEEEEGEASYRDFTFRDREGPSKNGRDSFYNSKREKEDFDQRSRQLTDQSSNARSYPEQSRNSGYREYEFEEDSRGGGGGRVVREPTVITAKKAPAAGISETNAYRSRERRHYLEHQQSDDSITTLMGNIDGRPRYESQRPSSTRILQYKIPFPTTRRLAEDLLRRAKEMPARA
ncbi:hypothetical protein HDU67_007508 [Dinochytrium kinnereticum]|nr:hypothetical protein HDU67_007508 [Dinochytrium kinnereticum]